MADHPDSHKGDSHKGEGHKIQSLEAISKDIDRKKLPLAEQTRRAGRIAKSEGITMSAAMARVARDHLRSQRAKPEPRATVEKGKKGSFTPSGPPKRDPFFSGPLKLTGKKVTRRGGRQPKK